MKILILMTLMSVSAFAQTTESFVLPVSGFASEAAVVEHATELIEQIENGKNETANQLMSWKYCRPLNKKFIKVNNLSVDKTYVNQLGQFEASYNGAIYFTHRSCPRQP
jgi:hypothetical protein